MSSDSESSGAARGRSSSPPMADEDHDGYVEHDFPNPALDPSLSQANNGGGENGDGSDPGGRFPVDDEEGSGEDLVEGAERDYVAIPAMDTYGKEGIDSQASEIEEMGVDDRREAERVMRERERRRDEIAGNRNAQGGVAGGRRNQIRAGLLDDSSEADAGRGGYLERRAARRRKAAGRAAGGGGGDGGDDDGDGSGDGGGGGGGGGGDGGGGGGGGGDDGFGGGGGGDDGGDDEGDMDDEDFDLGNPQGHLREWIQLEKPRRVIKRVFRTFLQTYTDRFGATVYKERIRTMCSTQGMSLEVVYRHLADDSDVLARYLVDSPAEILELFDEVALRETLTYFPEYTQIHPEIKVRITDLPTVDSLREIRHMHLNALIRVKGVVTRRSGVYPQLKAVKYDCKACGAIIGPFVQGIQEVRIGSCPDCQSKGPFEVNQTETVYQSYQRVTLQESPGTVPPGRLPRQKEVILLSDLIDRARPGDEVDITGVYTNNFDLALNRRSSFPVFATVIMANHLILPHDLNDQFHLSEEDVREIRELAARPGLVDDMVASVAPSIYGFDSIKLTLLLAMLGGEAKTPNEKTKLRGDINVLLLGDPGTAKSQFLKYVEKTASRAVFTTGQGASAVGLTATVRRDPVTRDWTLEGGALVLADRGVCLIDEFDKMNDADRVSIHEAMEQQSISIAKAGIVTTLQARCAVLAAANPIKGRYDPSLSFADNVDLTDPILSRFDVLCVVRDTIDPVRDEMLANFVVASHMRNHPHVAAGADADPHLDDATRAATAAAAAAAAAATTARAGAAGAAAGAEERTPVPQELLRKFIVYARQKVRPRLTGPGVDQDMITRLYERVRTASQSNGGMPVTVRFIESIIRLCEAHARLRLRDFVDEEDVDAAIRIAIDTFIGAQKQSVAASLRRSFSTYLRPRGGDDPLLVYILNVLVRENIHLQQLRANRLGREFVMPASVDVEVEDFRARAAENNVSNIHSFVGGQTFESNGYTVNEDKSIITRVFSAGGAEAVAADPARR